MDRADIALDEAVKDGRLRGEVQLEILRSKLLLSRGRELLDALLAVVRQRRN